MRTAKVLGLAVAVLWAGVAGYGQQTASPVVFADFEGATYGDWKVEGTAFGAGPASGTLPKQMSVTGFAGKRLVNSFYGGDAATGRLISPQFRITRPYIAFRIGGGGYAGRTCANLVVNGKVVRTATGPNTRPGGSEHLQVGGWDVRNLRGKTAHLEIIDAATGGWGHINMDQIEFTDNKPPLSASLRSDVTRRLEASGKWLNFPVRHDATRRQVTVRDDAGNIVRQEAIPLADDNKPDWWGPLDVSDWKGTTLTLTVDTLPENSRALESVTSSDAIIGHETLYKEPLRSQFHFSAQRGWLNDPNGLAYFNGEYHLFFQHSPFEWKSGVKYWGHAVSRDLVHWTEVAEAIYPDALGAIWSGSGVVDTHNTSGLGEDGKPPLVLLYTAAGNPFVQCLAYTTDGRRVTKFAGNPIIGNVTNLNRDPRVFWYEPTKQWVTALYVEKEKKHTVHFFTSPNLKEWTLTSITEGKPGDPFLFECPDIFELPLDGDPTRKKWILTGADSQYVVGQFDGKRFIAETPPLPGHRVSDFYAPQTFSDVPDGRRIQIGWWRTETRGMPFNQSMSLPLELRLVTTPNGPRLTKTPVRELESLRAKTHTFGPLSLKEGDTNPLASFHHDLLEIRAEFTPGNTREITFQVRGVPVVYDVTKQELRVNGYAVPAPLLNGKQALTVYVDRTGLEVFASEGHTYVPLPINLDPQQTNVTLTVSGGTASFTHLAVYELRSAWQ